VKELFPNEGNAHSQQCPKSTTRRNPLNFKQNPDQRLKLGAGRAHQFRSSSVGWCGQQISMYQSTCVPHSKPKLRSYEDESSDDSLTDGENDQCVRRNNKELDDRGCPSLSADQKLQLDDDAHLDDVGDHTVPSASQQDDVKDDHFADIRLRLSATTQYTEVSNPTQYKHGQREDTCVYPQAKDHPELNPLQESFSNLHGTCSTQIHVPQGIHVHLQDERSIRPKALAGGATDTVATHNNGGYISYPSMENLSELMKDMSVGDDIATNDHSIPADDQDPPKCEHTMSCNVHLEHHECIRPLNSTTIINASCDRHKVSDLRFNPHSASTPCRDQHMQIVNQTFNYSDPHKLLTAIDTTRVDITPGRLTEEQEMSILVRETPEHLWCSPNFHSVETHRAECDGKRSFRVSESVLQPTGLKSICNYSLNPTELSPQHTSCKLSDIDMTTFNNFDNTDTSRTTLGDSHSESTTGDMRGCLYPTVPPTQDSTHSSEGEWSVLVQQTPDEFWNSPVIRVVNDSLDST
jgi:hypothetical protein